MEKLSSCAVTVWFFHEYDIIGIEMAYNLDFDKSVGEEILSKDLIAVCYAYLYLTGEISGRGVWYQGKRVYGTRVEALGRSQCGKQQLLPFTSLPKLVRLLGNPSPSNGGNSLSGRTQAPSTPLLSLVRVKRSYWRPKIWCKSDPVKARSCYNLLALN